MRSCYYFLMRQSRSQSLRYPRGQQNATESAYVVCACVASKKPGLVIAFVRLVFHFCFRY